MLDPLSIFLGNSVATFWIANQDSEFDRKKMDYALIILTSENNFMDSLD